jgi:hypothetical protein
MQLYKDKHKHKKAIIIRTIYKSKSKNIKTLAPMLLNVKEGYLSPMRSIIKIRSS